MMGKIPAGLQAEVYSFVPRLRRTITNDPQQPDPNERIRALSVLLDRIIGRNQELTREVTTLKRRIAVLERQLAKRSGTP